MSYVDIVKDIIDNCYFTHFPKEFSRDGDLIAGVGDFFTNILNHEMYEIYGERKVFHDEKVVRFLKEYNKDNDGNFGCHDVRLEDALNSDRKVIIQFDLHPVTNFENPFEVTKSYFFDILLQDSEILENMRNGKVTLFFYQGWEAENFTTSTFPKDKFNGYYDLFDTILKEYNLPPSSIIILCSNLLGEAYEDRYRIKVIHDNAIELASFISFQKMGGTFTGFNKYALDYPIEEYIKNIKKCESKLLRVNRTPHPTRDWMLYILHKLKYFEESIVEHKYFDYKNIIYDGNFCNSGKLYGKKDESFSFISKIFDAHFAVNNEPHGTIPNLAIKEEDEKIFNKIDSDLPYIASNFEKNGVYISNTHHSNKAIPYDVYKKSIFSWVSVSLPDHANMVFLNQSTFNPVLNYHPIVWFGHRHTIKYFKKYGYKSYDWLFDESSDNIVEEGNTYTENTWKRMIHNIIEVNKVMSYDRDKLVSIIENNKDDLNHNRELLWKCKSIERIITKFYNILENNWKGI